MDYESLAAAISSWMRSVLESAGLRGFVVGLSGGIDSAVTAALSVRAVGAENTHAVVLPCHSEPEDAAYAHLVAEALSLRPEVIDLSGTYDALAAALPEGGRMARANVKPRLRMATLYYIAQSRGCLVAGTGNRPELLVGYFTKYGDGGVDLEPLGELHKHEVRSLAVCLDIPTPVITRPPTAGLWPGQTDEEELGISYEDLDAILDALDAGAPVHAPIATVERVRSMVAASAHKRALPPVFHVERSAPSITANPNDPT